MHDLFVTQNEIGVIDGTNRAQYRQLITYGASPCVIVTVFANGTCMLAHVHEDSCLLDFETQIQEIFPPQAHVPIYQVGLYGEVPSDYFLRLSHSQLRDALWVILTRLFPQVPIDQDRVYSGRRMRAENGRTYPLTDGAALTHGELTLQNAFVQEGQMQRHRFLERKTPMFRRTLHTAEEHRQNDLSGNVAELLWQDNDID